MAPSLVPHYLRHAMRYRWVMLLLFAIGAVVFWPLMSAQFTLWDDAPNVWQNARIAEGRGISTAWTSTDDAIYMPVTRTVWAILAAVATQPKDWMGSTLSPLPFHAANVLIHLANALLVYRLLRKLELAMWPAIVGGLLFALHPLQVEAVGWVSGLKDVLAAGFSLAAMNAHVDAAAIADETKRRRWRITTAVFVALAVLSKPTALVTPAILLFMDVLALGRTWRCSLRELAVPMSIAPVTAIVGAVLQPALVTPPVAVHLRPTVAADAVMFYLRKLVAPVGLGLDYGRTPRAVLTGDRDWVPVVVVVVAGVAVGAFAWFLVRSRKRLEVLGLIVFVVALAPVLGWKQFEFQYYSTVADHYVYFAMVGPALLVASAIERINRKSSRVVASTFAVVVVATLGFLAHRQTHLWRDSESLATHTLDVNPHSIAARSLLGGFRDLQANAAAAHGRNAEAMVAWKRSVEEFDHALAIDPSLVPALDAAATACWRIHNLVDPLQSASWERRAMDYWIRLDELVPSLPAELRDNFADLPLRLGKIALDLDLNEDAVRYYERAAAGRPFDPNINASLQLARSRLDNPSTSQPSR